jgi:N-acyl homoserine lactone hydrolase
LRIHALTTGDVRVKHTMQRGRGRGLLRRARMFGPGDFTAPLPIHVWAIEHPEGLLLVDAGATAAARDQPFARFAVEREDELDRALRRAGFAPSDVDTVVLTHVHGDHVEGLPHVPAARVLASEAELHAVASPGARLTRAAVRQPLPAGFAPEPLRFDGAPVGAFAASAPITADGRVLAVPTPGHTPGHLAVLVLQDDHHVLLGGDSAYDQDQLLDRRVDGVSPRADVARQTMQTILDHGGLQPTVYLPSHDPAAAARLAATEVLPV